MDDYARHLLLSLEATLAIILPYYAGFFFSKSYGFSSPEIAGLWCAISGIIVLQVLVHESFSAGWLRILGSFVGAFTSYIFTALFGANIPTLAACIFVTVMLTAFFKIKQTFRLACLTAAIIFIIKIIDPSIPAFMNAFSRFVESALGSGIAVMITAVFYPLRKKLQLLDHSVK